MREAVERVADGGARDAQLGSELFLDELLVGGDPAFDDGVADGLVDHGSHGTSPPAEIGRRGEGDARTAGGAVSADGSHSCHLTFRGL